MPDEPPAGGRATGAGARPETQDFAGVPAISTIPPTPAPEASAPTLPRSSQHVHYAEDGADAATALYPPALVTEGITRSDTALSLGAPISPLRRRATRAATFKTVEDFGDFQVRPGWQPGSEPGVDPSKPDGGHASMPTLSAPCEISVVDFSQEEMSMLRFDNDSLVPFLKQPQPGWAKCRWINVNGLSWDVIQALGQYKRLHKLAIEDIMNTRNRTKAEWFSTHAFIVLTLQKLVHTYDSDSEDGGDSDDDARSWTSGRSGRSRQSISRRIRRMFRNSGKRQAAGARFENGDKYKHPTTNPYVRGQSTGSSVASNPGTTLRTIQRYHSSPNDARTDFMEKHSSLAPSHLAVAAEQVAVFVTQDNTVISFFEISAEDVERPIVRRLQTPDTILRQSCDASMICQAIIDAIIDLAIPVTASYTDVIGDLELDVLTRPNLRHTKKLYIIITEINKMLSFIVPITNLINALRDHKTNLSEDAALKELHNPLKGVVITPMTYTYLGDVLDHCFLITDNLNQLKNSADGMIDLIFNTISAYQNESMKQLTVATIIFLPLTFMTGYFGQNFTDFDDLGKGVSFFWMIAAPVSVAVVVLLMREMIWDYIRVLMQRRHIAGLRRLRLINRRKRA